MSVEKRLFLGIKQMTKTAFLELQDSEKVGYIWFVKCEDPVHFEVYLGTKKYGETNETVEDLIREIAEKLKVAIGLTDELTLPDDFQYENILDNLEKYGIRITDLEERVIEAEKAIRDTEKVVEELSELPLYPSEEQLGIIYAYNGKLYRAKKLNTLTLDFSKIEGHEDEWGRIIVNKTDIVNFINSQGLNIVNENYISIYDNGGEEVYELVKENNSLVFPFGYQLVFHQEGNGENTLYFRTTKFEVSAPYNDEENFGGVFIADGDDLSDSHTYGMPQTDLPEEDIPAKHVNLLLSNSDIENFPMDYLCIGRNGLTNFFLYSLGIDLVRCYSEEDYYNGIFHDFLVWEEVSEEELSIKDTTPATEDTRKRFYREIENNNIYVTDTETKLIPGGFEIIINCNTISQKNNEEVKQLIDPENLWVDYIDEVTNCYGAPFLNNNPPINFTPLRIGANKPGNIALEATQNVVLKFSPYFQYYNGEWQSETVEKDADITIYLNGDKYYNITIPRYQGGNDIESLQYYEISIPIGYINIEASRRVYLHTISHGNKETTYTWSQIAKVQDIHDAINALPEVARTGSYTDLFNKPCVGDVQTYDWPNSEDLPIIEEGSTESCENRFKQLLRCNNSLYTAVHNGSGLSLDLRQFSRNYKTQGYCGNSLRNFIFQDRIDIVSDAYEDYYVSGDKILIQNTKSRGMQLGSGKEYGSVLLAMRDYGNNKRFLFNEVEVDLQSWNGPDSDMKDYTTDNANVYIEIGTSECINNTWELFVEREMKGGTAYIRSTDGTPTDVFISVLVDGYTNVNYNGEVYNVIKYTYSDYVGAWLLGFDKPISTVEGEYVTFVDHETPGAEVSQILTPQKTENIWFKIYSDENVNNPVLKETVKLTGTNCDYIKIWTQYDENPKQYGRRCIVKGITFNNLKYEYDPNPIYNRDIYKKDYWKQINASIKVIDLTGEN